MTERVKGRKRVFSGTWEEIAAQADEFAGRRVTLTVEPAEEPAQEPAEEGPSLAETLAPLIEKAKHLERGMPVATDDPHERAFGEIMDEKARRLGLKI